MGTKVIIGAQWGDEGKGKIVSVLAEKADAVVRFHGGNNAGHTLYHNSQKFTSHLVPSGVFNSDANLFIGRGVVLDLSVLNQEIADLKTIGVSLQNRLSISPNCHIIMPYHKVIDGLIEGLKGDNKTGTTRRGIGPVYADKLSYNGIRLVDLQGSSKFIIEKLEVQIGIKNRIIMALGGDPLNLNRVHESLMAEYDKMSDFVNEGRGNIREMIDRGRNILFEGAQGVMLDNDWGTYPFVTASSAMPGNIQAGAGIPIHLIKNLDVIGVVKCYTTRVGNGPFPTELTGELGDRLQKAGDEVGATTGRVRRCGWLDMVLLRYAVDVAGITELVLTKLDVLDSLDEIKVGVSYNSDSPNRPPVFYDPDDMNSEELSEVRLNYITFPGWKESIRGVRKYSDLPHNAKLYIEAIQRMTGILVTMISVGPNNEETIEC